MLNLISNLRHLLAPLAGEKSVERASHKTGTYDKDLQKPVLKCSICSGEQVAGFKDIRTGKFEEVMLVKNKRELEDFMKMYGIDEISKEY